MSLSDLELLQLVETAKEKRRGPKGEPGVGIDRIEQYDGESFTIKLTDGNYKKITLQPGRDGEAGEPGPIGPRGEQGVEGRAGRAGAAGTSGQDGLPGLPGTSVDTAVVNANGHLLLGFTDGSIIDVGRVVGPAGEGGERGATGLPGQAGQDGAAVLSGPRVPTQDDGVDGDHWIDISSAEFSFFKKSGEGWQLLANLRQPAKNPAVAVPVGGGSGGGGGVDLPPVIIDIDPPATGNNNKPVRQGDLWFDSDQLALYVATKDSSKSIVWVICIPGVTGVPGTQTASVPVVYPKAVDGEEWLNPLTQITYRYNAPKKQWINVNGGIVSVQDKPPQTPQTGSLWFDTEDDELTLYLYTGSEWVPAAPPVSLDGINATIDAALVVQNDLKTRITEGESKQKTLQNKVAALEGTVIDGKWYAESRSTPRTGGFDITKGGVQSMSDWDADFIRVHKTDTTGKVFTFAEVSTGDYIRIGAPDSTAVYKITDAPTGSLDWQAFGVELANSTGTPFPDLTYDFEFLPSFDPSAYATIQYVDVQDDLDVKKTGDIMTGDLKFDGADRTITALGGNRLRIGARDSSSNGRTFFDVQTVDSSGTEGTDSGYRCKIYHLATPTAPLHAANKKYVDDQIAAIPAPTGSVPVGSIMIWMNSTAPDGWFKLQGGNFDVSTYPKLHAYLQGTSGYTSGKLPSWGGHYPGEYGDHLNQSLGSKQGAKTAQPSGGAPTSTSNTIPTGATRTFTATGNTNAYSNGQGRVAIGNGWDSTTRPKTVVVHYIIRHD